MRKIAFYKDIKRTLKNNLSRFIAIVVMAALGTGVFTGFAVGCLDVFEAANRFYDKQNTYDIKIASTLGLTDDDLSAVSKLSSVNSVFGNRSMDVITQNDEKLLLANLITLDYDGMNSPYVIEGMLPTRAGQIAVNSKFSRDTGLQLGDIITLSEEDTAEKSDKSDGTAAVSVDEETDLGISIEDDSTTPSLAIFEYEITAIILSPLDISNSKDSIASISFSSSSSDYMMYATKECIDSDIYTAIYLTIEGAAETDCYSAEYKALVDNMTATIETTILEDRQQARYDEVVGNANRKISEAEELLADKIAEMEQKLSDAQKELKDSEAKLTDGQTELDAHKSEFTDSITAVRQKLNKAKEDVANISMTKLYVWDRSDNDSFTGLNNDISFIQAVTKAFPIIFFLVAILVSLTTMTRMVEEDRALIGTYKSLGYSKFQISLKYILYAILACVGGGTFGNLIGFFALPKVIEIIVSSLYVLPTFKLSFYPVYALGGFSLFLLGIAGATVISCVEMLHKRPAELMRPKAPKEGSRILLERIPFIWKRLNFLNKVTCRNLFRYKKRAIMTIVGILGCMMLIVLGFGVKDTVGGLMSDQFDNVTVYDAIVVTDNLNAAEMDLLDKELISSGRVKDELQLQISTMTLWSNRDNVDITVMVIPDGTDLEPYVHLQDSTTNEKMSLTSDGIIVTQNAAKQLDLKRGSIVSLQNADNLEHDFPVAFVTTNNAGNYVYISESSYQEAFGNYNGTSFLLNLTEATEDQKWLDTLSEDDRILTVSSSQEVRETFGDVKKIINMVVYLLISMSAVLALTVLFTLSNINISERERELATMKVLGFKPQEVFSYVNKETFILTLLGILLGMPSGYGITYAILANVSIADTAFNVRVSIAAYLIAAIITFIFTLLVNKITNKALRKINMVEALKSVE